MKSKDAMEVIGYILSKDFGMIFLEIILGIIHIWIISTKYYVPMYLKIALCIIFIIVLIYLYIRVNTAIKVFREKHIPIVVAVAISDDETKGKDEVRAVVNDVLDSMNEYNFDEKTFEDDFYMNRDTGWWNGNPLFPMIPVNGQTLYIVSGTRSSDYLRCLV